MSSYTTLKQKMEQYRKEALKYEKILTKYEKVLMEIAHSSGEDLNLNPGKAMDALLEAVFIK